ncbi:hypothetical protein ACIBG8_45210 [Nonomuraea sp. NPDC050556]|uniref:hypothetical protein n=1 Tax=Nonomuraea sp. NPDC050556 TaxID=3364369 RepID=UPI0037A78C20
MAAAKKPDCLDSVLEHEGLLWKPRQGATSSAEEFLAARALFKDLHDDATWNPWVLNERAAELEQAEQIMGQWKRAEPGHRVMTKKQIDARMARWEREFKERLAADEERHERDRSRYDPAREHARLSLIEHQSRLEFELYEVAGLRDGSRFPAMDPRRRTEQVAKLDDSIARIRAQIERLADTTGDPEDVVDERGWLPRDRREALLFHYRLDRQFEVEDLRTRVPDLDAALKATKGRDARAKLRTELDQASRRLEKLLAVPNLTAEDMCSECQSPFARHGWSMPPWDGPCPAWPGWATRVKEARKILLSAHRTEEVVQPRRAKPEPLAVIPSGLPITEVLERLTALQTQYPDAEVRRGRANRWELWPNSSTS